jgi:hypothetical protein
MNKKMTEHRAEPAPTEPVGCLACNYDAIDAFLAANKFDPGRMVRVVPHAALESQTCSQCDAAFIVEPPGIEHGQRA